MAGSVHNLMPSDDATISEIDQQNLGGFEESRPRQAGRRKSKQNEAAAATQQKKKQPQRGMGVAQLERLRLQERWKKLTHHHHHNNNINPYPLQTLLKPHNPHFLAAPLPDPTSLGAHPAPFGKFGSYGAMGGVGQNQALLFQRPGNGGLLSGSGVGGAFSEQLPPDPYGIGASNLGMRVANVADETLTELSSIPNAKCVPDYCGFCHKKKRFNGEISGCKSSINGDSFLRLNLGDNQKLAVTSTAPIHAGSPVPQEVEVVAVHRKGSGLMMEYEFFPGRGGCEGSTTKDYLNSSEASVAVVDDVEGGYNCVATATTTITCSSSSPFYCGFDASNSVDLCLRLSN